MTNARPLYLEPVEKEYLWGRETWVLSCHPQGPCKVRQPEGVAFCTLHAAAAEETAADFDGTAETSGEVLPTLRDLEWPDRDFPLLIKIIDARESLSVQVHPGDSYAQAQEGSQGKTEMWYILDHEPDAYLYYGLKHKVTENEFRKRLKNGSILEICQKVPVKKGEVYFIPPGMLHAIGKGIRLAEVQQSSSITYRVYDYDREDQNHNKRQLHVEQAVDVMGFVPAMGGHSPLGQREKYSGYSRILLASCPYFSVWSYKVTGSLELDLAALCSNAPFASLVVLRGEGTLSWEETEENWGDFSASEGNVGPTNAWKTQALREGDSVYLPRDCKNVTVEGRVELLVSVPPQGR